MEIARGIKRVLRMTAKPHASFSTQGMGTVDGGTTAATAMTPIRMAKEKGNLPCFSPRKIKRSKRRL
jgi:hypothetical protein